MIAEVARLLKENKEIALWVIHRKRSAGGSGPTRR
jgi:ribosomal protein L39E